MTRQMDLFDVAIGHCFQIDIGIEIEVRAGDEDVVDVQQYATSGPARQLRQKFRLGDRRMAKSKIARRILDENLPAERVLGTRDILCDDIECFLSIRKR